MNEVGAKNQGGGVPRQSTLRHKQSLGHINEYRWDKACASFSGLSLVRNLFYKGIFILKKCDGTM